MNPSITGLTLRTVTSLCAFHPSPPTEPDSQTLQKYSLIDKKKKRASFTAAMCSSLNTLPQQCGVDSVYRSQSDHTVWNSVMIHVL